jgi:hypothetical protein
MGKKNNPCPASVEILDTVINAFGSPHFDTEKVCAEIYEKCEKDGSIMALLNALPMLVKAAKSLY